MNKKYTLYVDSFIRNSPFIVMDYIKKDISFYKNLSINDRINWKSRLHIYNLYDYLRKLPAKF
jgi:hypothetical protein